MKVWIDGAVIDGEDARLPVTDHGLLYGDGVFEGLRVYGGRVFRIGAHLDRLRISARAIGLALPAGLRAIVEETVAASGLADAYVRLIVTRGSGALGVDPTTCAEPRVICIVDRVELYSDEVLARGLDMVTVSVRRAQPDALESRVKSLNYLTSVLAKREAVLRGADEALLLNGAGRVAEAAVANVFAVRDGVLLTPPAIDGALEGITRSAVCELAREAGVEVRETSLARIDLLAAEEVFLTGTGARIVPVRSLDGEPIGPVPGPLTKSLSEEFRALVGAPAAG